MPLRHLLAIALVVLPLSAFAQNKQDNLAPANQPATSAATVSEPWRILPSDAPKPSLQKDDALLQARAAHMLASVQDQGILLADGPHPLPGLLVPMPSSKEPMALPGDSYCLKIRSYVVARDSKNSDSTHLVSYSTCQPASRYRLKTIELQAQPAIP